MSDSVEELRVQIVAKADEIKAMKAAGAAKDALTPHITILLELKEKWVYLPWFIEICILEKVCIVQVIWISWMI